MQQLALKETSPKPVIPRPARVAVLPPRPGMAVRVRDRAAVVIAVEPSEAGGHFWLHLTDVEYTDGEEPVRDRLLWEIESVAETLAPLPPERLSSTPMEVERFRSYVRAEIWQSPDSLSPQRGSKRAKGLLKRPAAAPLLASVDTQEYQLVPLEKALAMPRIRLLIADDVGLGKTIEAGLICAELLRRRRIRRVLVLCPPALRYQWQEEMLEKFGLEFAVLDGTARSKLARQAGPEANQWLTSDLCIASFYYLREPRVLEEFSSACIGRGRPHLPWDLLIVDEAHNLMPAAGSKDSKLTTMLRRVSRWFEHRIFLTATPHNGYRSSFTGLLEILDPVRFRRTSCPSAAEKRRIREVVVRRMKGSVWSSGPGRVACGWEVVLAPQEEALFAAFRRFRETVARWGRVGDKRVGASFIIEVLSKRLLSSTTAFAASFQAFLRGILEQDGGDLTRAMLLLPRDGRDDAELPWKRAASAMGTWMRKHFPGVRSRLDEISAALEQLGVDPLSPEPAYPVVDSRFSRLCDWIEQHLRERGRWLSNERAIVFTEYRVTLNMLVARLNERFPDDAPRFLRIAGDTSETARKSIVSKFQAPGELSLLLSTGTASEGLNLHQHCRYVFHFDIPWNPLVIDQRIGRVDRRGQTRLVKSFHFTSGTAPELRLLSRVAAKVESVRQDLDTINELLAAKVQHGLVRGRKELFESTRDRHVEGKTVPDEAPVCTDTSTTALGTEVALLRRNLVLFPKEQIETLKAASLVTRGAAPQLALAPAAWEEGGSSTHQAQGEIGAASRTDAPLLPNPGHMIYRRALSLLASASLPGPEGEFARWTILCMELPAGMDAALLFFEKLLAVNAARWLVLERVDPVLFPLRRETEGWETLAPFGVLDTGAKSGSAMARGNDLVLALSREALRATHRCPAGHASLELVGEIWTDCSRKVIAALEQYQERCRRILEAKLVQEKRARTKELKKLFSERLRELEEASRPSNIRRLYRRLSRLEAQRRYKGFLFRSFKAQVEAQASEIRLELDSFEKHLASLRMAVSQEQERALSTVTPDYTLAFPPVFNLVGLAFLLPPKTSSLIVSSSSSTQTLATESASGQRNLCPKGAAP